MSEHEEYTRDTYPSFGKLYNGEKGIISLTSWKARINTVSKTLYSLVKQCPGFHIVLVLSEEEFPRMTEELPHNLMLFIDNKLIELMFVFKNYKSFKKVLFTMDKYRDVPVISADDGCIYVMNYAQELYDIWKDNPKSLVSVKKYNGTDKSPYKCGGGGWGILFPPYCFKDYGKKCLLRHGKEMAENPNDDRFLGILASKMCLKWVWMKDLNRGNMKTFVDICNGGLSESNSYKGGINWKFKDFIEEVLK